MMTHKLNVRPVFANEEHDRIITLLKPNKASDSNDGAPKELVQIVALLTH